MGGAQDVSCLHVRPLPPPYLLIVDLQHTGAELVGEVLASLLCKPAQ
jgi:hypothetical protein